MAQRCFGSWWTTVNEGVSLGGTMVDTHASRVTQRIFARKHEEKFRGTGQACFAFRPDVKAPGASSGSAQRERSGFAAHPKLTPPWLAHVWCRKRHNEPSSTGMKNWRKVVVADANGTITPISHRTVVVWRSYPSLYIPLYTQSHAGRDAAGAVWARLTDC